MRSVLGSARLDFVWFLDLYSQGKVQLDELISRYRPLEELNEAGDDMNQKKVARTVIVFE